MINWLATSMKASPTIINGDKASTSPKRVNTLSKKNVAVIHSGQDSSCTTPEERKLYLETMHRILKKEWISFETAAATLAVTTADSWE